MAAGIAVRDRDGILSALARIAFANITDFFDEHGHLRAVEDLPGDLVAANASIKVVQWRLPGQKGVVLVKKVALPNRLKALELLARLHGLLQDREPVRDDAALLARLDARRKCATAET